MDPTIYDVVLHAGLPLASSGIAGLGAYYGVKFAIKDHANRLDLIMRRETWVVRKLITLCAQHNMHHPGSIMNVDDFPTDDGDAFRV